jgi:hypothetical protein
MTAWAITKQYFTRGKTPGSTGYLIAPNDAADYYLVIQPHLRQQNKGESESAFNADTELREALLMRGQLESVRNLI